MNNQWKCAGLASLVTLAVFVHGESIAQQAAPSGTSAPPAAPKPATPPPPTRKPKTTIEAMEQIDKLIKQIESVAADRDQLDKKIFEIAPSRDRWNSQQEKLKEKLDLRRNCQDRIRKSVSSDLPRAIVDWSDLLEQESVKEISHWQQADNPDRVGLLALLKSYEVGETDPHVLEQLRQRRDDAYADHASEVLGLAHEPETGLAKIQTALRVAGAPFLADDYRLLVTGTASPGQKPRVLFEQVLDAANPWALSGQAASSDAPLSNDAVVKASLESFGFGLTDAPPTGASAKTRSASGGKPTLSEVRDLLEASQFESAIQALIKADPKSYQAHFYRALALYKLNRLDEAKAEVGTARKLPQADTTLLDRILHVISDKHVLIDEIQRGNAALAQKIYPQVASNYKAAWRLFPTRDDIGLAAAKAWFKAKEYRQSEEIAEEVLTNTRDASAAQECTMLLAKIKPRLNPAPEAVILRLGKFTWDKGFVAFGASEKLARTIVDVLRSGQQVTGIAFAAKDAPEWCLFTDGETVTNDLDSHRWAAALVAPAGKGDSATDSVVLQQKAADTRYATLSAAGAIGSRANFAFASGHGWAAVDARGKLSYGGELSRQAMQELKELADADEAVSRVALAPQGGYVIITAANGHFLSPDTPAELHYVLEAMNFEQKKIEVVVYAPDGAWIVVTASP